MSENVYLRELLNPDGVCYSLCGLCGCQVPKMADARWVDTGAEYPHLTCTECADRHTGESWDVVAAAEVLEVVSCTEEINTLQDRIRELEDQKIAAIRKMLKDEGVEIGMAIHHRSKPYIVTGISVTSHFHNNNTVKVVMHPAKKDGAASKQHVTDMIWNQFLKLWRMQRADVSAYVERCKKADEEGLRRYRERKIKDSDL